MLFRTASFPLAHESYGEPEARGPKEHEESRVPGKDNRATEEPDSLGVAVFSFAVAGRLAYRCGHGGVVMRQHRAARGRVLVRLRESLQLPERDAHRGRGAPAWRANRLEAVPARSDLPPAGVRPGADDRREAQGRLH